VTDPVPELAIVIAAPEPAPVLSDCLAALEKQRHSSTEVVLAAASDAESEKRRFPWLRIVHVPGARSLPVLRGAGIAATQAPLVAVLDPWCVVGNDWISAAVAVHGERSEAVAGGEVELAPSERRSLAAWATYLFDYWEYIPPIAAQRVAALPGNNIVYKRRALPSAAELRQTGFWKAFVNARLKANGEALWLTPRLRVQMRRRLPIAAFVRSRYHHGRSFAAMRVSESSWITRLGWAVAAPGLPVLLFVRQLRGVMPKPGARAWLVPCAPLLLAFDVSWAFGEFCGYLFGPGRSHDVIRS
jgi:hypothetical protein